MKNLFYVVLFLLFLIQLLFFHVPKVVHEIVGLLLVPMLIHHVWQTKRWWASILRGRYSAYRILTTLLNFSLLALVLAIIVTGVLISNELFAGIVPLSIRKMIVLHELHKALPWYFLLVMSVHVGLHLPFQRTSRRTRSLLLLIAMSGMLVGTTEHMLLERLSFAHVFGTPAQMAGLPAAFVSLLGIAFFGIFAGGILRLRLAGKE